MADWVIQLIVFVVTQVISYALRPKAKTSQKGTSQDIETPTAEAGLPVAVVFGRITLKTVNVCGYWQKSKFEHEEKV